MKKVLLVAVSVLLVCTSCVTKKKYLLAENGRLEAIARGDDLQNQLVNCRDNNDGLTSRLASLERDTTRMGKNIRNYQSMLNTNMTEQEKLNSLLSQKMNELDERERTINELQDMINAQTERVQNLLNSVKDALLGFSSDELTVREKDGKVYVAMSDKLLFESGSARVDKRGKELWHNSQTLTNNPTSTFISKGIPIASRSTPPSLKTTGISVSSAPLRSSAS